MTRVLRLSLACCLTASAILEVCHAADNTGGPNAVLSFEAGDEIEMLSLGALKQELKSHTISLFDPVYKKQKRYAAFALADVLRMGFQKNWESGPYDGVAFIAIDGYEAIASQAIAKEQGGYVAFQDLDVDHWETIGPQKVNPGPFYVVWTGKNQSPKAGYPWPYQLRSLKLILPFAQQYPKVYPAGASEESAVFKGFTLFRKNCFACHALSRQGGTVGPDLNAPQNITQYRPLETLKTFIKAPSKFRYTKMPDNPTLSDTDLDAVLSYLQYMAQHK